MTSRIKRFLALPILRKQSVVQATVIITILTFLSKFVGYAREVLVAKYFGTSWQLDAYLVGSQIPMMVLGLFAGGFGSLIIPKYLENKKISHENALRYVNQIFVVWSAFFVVMSIFIVLFAPFLVHLIAIGFKEERFNLAVKITRYLSLYGLLNILMSFLIGILQSEKQFLIPTLLSLIGNVLTLLSLLFLTKYIGIQSLSIGSTLFVVFNFVILYTLLFQKYRFFQIYHLTINWAEIRDFAFLLFPLVVSSGLGTLNVLADRIVSSWLPIGSISAINFASRIWGIPIALIVGSFTVTLLSHFSEKACDETKLLELKQSINKSLILMFYTMIPISILFLTMSQPIVRLFYQRGAFSASDTILTTNINRMYSLGLVAFATFPILVKVYFAFKNIWTPVWISIGTVALNFIGNVILSKHMGPAGIALSTSFACIIGYIVAYYLLGQYFPKVYFDIKSIRTNLIMEFSKTLACSLLIGGISILILPFLNIPGSFIASIIKIAFTFVLLSIIFIFLSSIFQTEGYALIKPFIVNLKLKVQKIGR